MCIVIQLKLATLIKGPVQKQISVSNLINSKVGDDEGSLSRSKVSATIKWLVRMSQISVEKSLTVESPYPKHKFKIPNYNKLQLYHGMSMISQLLHEYEVKPSTSVNNYDIIQVHVVKLACTMPKKLKSTLFPSIC